MFTPERCSVVRDIFLTALIWENRNNFLRKQLVNLFSRDRSLIEKCQLFGVPINISFNIYCSPGLIKSIGVSNYTIDHLEELLEYATITPAVLQVLTLRPLPEKSMTVTMPKVKFSSYVNCKSFIKHPLSSKPPFSVEESY